MAEARMAEGKGGTRTVVARRDGFVIDTDPGAVDLEVVVGFLRTTYWAGETAPDVLERSIRNALVWSLKEATAGTQAGFARVVTDCARFAWLSDVFVLDAHRGRGLGGFLVETVLADPRLLGIPRWLLATRDMHPLYRRFGFEDAPGGRYMVLTR